MTQHSRRSRPTFIIALALALALAVARCAAPAAAHCVPGETQPCLCAGARVGAQSCNELGAGWRRCECDEPTPPASELDASAPSMSDAAADHSARVDARPTTDATDPPDSAATVDAATPPEGAAVYQRLCSACHGADGRGRAGVGPAIDEDVRDESDLELRSLFERGEDRMPPVPMSNAEFAALISYLRSTFGAYQPED